MNFFRTFFFYLCGIVFLIVFFLYMQRMHDEGGTSNVAYDHMMHDGVIRCGYGLREPYLERASDESGFGGLMADLTSEIARLSHTTVRWEQEADAETAFPSLKEDKFDVFCGYLDLEPKHGEWAQASTLLAQIPFYVYAREGATGFHGDYDDLDNKQIRIAYRLDSAGGIAKRRYFPEAVSLPITESSYRVFFAVVSGEANAAIGTPKDAAEFSQKHPGVLRRVEGAPVYLKPLTLYVAVGEGSLKHFLNEKIAEISKNGGLDAMIQRWMGPPGHYYLMPNSRK
jgi:ABC-type amino acid transport substrate-binding protein